jgi:N-methylhydantoinase B/oxoprolinase/acetone carboxylase alpha subunit
MLCHIEKETPQVKIRNGFVSNSSSSSFVIALCSKDVCPTCGRGSHDLLSMAERDGDYETEVAWNKLGKDVDKTDLVDDYDYQYMADYIDKVLKYASENPEARMAKITCSDHNRTLTDEINYQAQDGNIVIIDKCDD